MIFKFGNERALVASRIEFIELSNYYTLHIYTNASKLSISGDKDILEHIMEYLIYVVKGDLNDYELDKKYCENLIFNVEKKH